MSQQNPDVEKVEEIAQKFDNCAEISDSVVKALEVTYQMLRTTGLVGKIGDAQIESYLSEIQPHLQSLSNKYREYASDIRNLRGGDQDITT